jgi:integrase
VAKKYKKKYESWGGRELVSVINGKVCGVKFDNGKAQSYYYRHPQLSGPAKKINLGRNKGKAASKWWSIVEEHQKEQLQPLPTDQLKTQKTYIVSRQPHQTEVEFDAMLQKFAQVASKKKEESLDEWNNRVFNNPKLTAYIDKIETSIPKEVLANIFNKWLEDPYECSRLLGREEIANLHKLSSKDPIPLSKMADYYFNYIPTEREQASETERKKVKKWFEQFIRIIGKTYLDDIRQKDISGYTQSILNMAKQQNQSNTWISHRWGAVKTVIRIYGTCTEDKTELDRNLRIWQDFRSPGSNDFNPALITKKQFEKLLSNVNIKWKAMIYWSLNTCSYPIDVRLLKINDINWEDGTIAYRRKKTKVPKCGVLWKNTVKAIKDYMKERKGESDYLFLSRHKSLYSEGGFSDYVRKYIRPKVNWNFEFSQIRDSARYAAEKGGVSSTHIHIAMGHRIKGQDDAYLLRHPELVKDVSKAIYNYYFSKSKKK